jgi:hypothetical protein
MWDECNKIRPDAEFPTCQAAISNCSSYGALYENSTCSGNIAPPPPPGDNPPPISPIIKPIPTQVSGNALIAMQNAVNLQLLENATLRIYDMKGKVVMMQKVGKGNYHVQLQLPRGLYIAKATSSSWKQTIKVAVK